MANEVYIAINAKLSMNWNQCSFTKIDKIERFGR